MTNNLDNLFKKLPTVEPAIGLKKTVLANIFNFEHRRVRNQKIFYGLMGVSSFTAAITMAVKFFSYITQSGFFDYFSLVSSEKVSILTFSKELGLVLLESIPIVGFAFFLGAFVILIWSLSSLLGNRSASLKLA